MNKKIIKSLTIYILLFVVSVFATYILFAYKGVNSGDDAKYHFPNILDEYSTMISSYRLSSISGNLAAGIGAGNRLFYSPLAHFVTSLMAVILKVFNISLLQTYKIVVFLSVYVSGIFMYFFANHITNKKIASFLVASIYILYPYRLFDAFCRLAFAEAFSFIFLPLFFMGLYDILQFDKKIQIKPFVEIIIGGSLLFLSHNLTAFYSFIFGILFIVFNIKKVIKVIKLKHFISISALSIVLLLGISSISWVSEIELLSSNLYNISDRARMWTDIEHILNRTSQEWDYSGFLNIKYMVSAYPNLLTVSSLIMGMMYFALLTLAYFMVDIFLTSLSKYKFFKYAHLIISTAIYITLTYFVCSRLEILLSSILVSICYIFIQLTIKNTNNNDKIVDHIYKDINFWFLLISIIFIFFLMENEGIWKILPSIFLNIQFPWRLWAIVQLFIAIILALVFKYYSLKKVTYFISIILLGILLCTNQPLFEKRMIYNYKIDDIETTTRWYMDIDEQSYNYVASLGWNREYMPQVFYESNYKSEYRNSLYSKIARIIKSSTIPDYAYELTPVILDGNATIEINSNHAPWYDLNINVLEDSYIQLTYVYYPGYQITINNLDTNEIEIIEPDNVDGLLAFSLKEGKYNIKTDYVGTMARKTSFIYFYVSIYGLISMIALSIIFKNKKVKVVEVTKNKRMLVKKG